MQCSQSWSLFLPAVLALSRPASGQDVKSVDLMKIKNNNYLYVIGGKGDDVFAGIIENAFVQPDDKLPAVQINMGNSDEKEVTLKPSAKSNFLYTFFYGDKVYTLEYGVKPLDNGMYSMNLVSWDGNLSPEKTVSDTVKMTSNVFRYDLASAFKDQFTPLSGRWRRSYLFSHAESPDGKKIIIMLNNAFQTKPPRSLYCILFNPETSKMGQYNITIPSDDANMVVEDYAVDNDGKVYLLASGYKDNSFTKKPDNFKYYLYEYSPAKNVLSPAIPVTSDHFVTNLGMVLTSGGTSLRLAGLYTDPSTMKVSGTACFTLNSKGTLDGHFTPLDEAVLNKLYKGGTKQEDHADEYDIRNIFPEANGDLTFFAEHYARKLGVGMNVSLLGGVSPKPQLEDHYGDIVITRIKQDGSPEWTSVVEKDQKSTDENIMYNSFAVIKKAGNYGLLYNENVKSLSNVDWVSLNADGTTSKKTIFDKSKDKLRVAPMLAGIDDEGNMFIPAVRYSKTKLIKVSF